MPWKSTSFICSPLSYHNRRKNQHFYATNSLFSNIRLLPKQLDSSGIARAPLTERRSPFVRCPSSGRSNIRRRDPCVRADYALRHPKTYGSETPLFPPKSPCSLPSESDGQQPPKHRRPDKAIVKRLSRFRIFRQALLFLCGPRLSGDPLTTFQALPTGPAPPCPP